MKYIFATLLLSAASAGAASSPDWILETPLEFIASGRFQSPSDGQDILVVEKATGLARLGLKNGAAIDWTTQATGIDDISGLTTIRNGVIDSIAASSQEWNAVQLVTPGAEPQTLGSPVVGPRSLARLSTGQAAGAVVEDILAFTRMAQQPDAEQVGAADSGGGVLFTAPAPGLPEQAQFLSLTAAPAVPVLISVRNHQLRLDRMDRNGFIAGGFDIGAAAPEGLKWAAARKTWLFTIANNSTTLNQHRLASTSAGGYSQPSALEETTPHTLPEAVISLDTVPFTDPAYPSLDSLVAVRHVSTQDVVTLYRLLDEPVPSITPMMSITIPAGAEFAGLLALGDDFMVLSGPGGRARSWDRYAQPAPGALPQVVASGSIPSGSRRAAHPNIFIFDNDPLLTEGAVLTSSRNRLDWTTVSATSASGETDSGPAAGLGSLETITVSAPGGVPIGNQLLATASVAGFGPLNGLARAVVTFSPSPGAYGALEGGRGFPIRLRVSPSGGTIQYRTDAGPWAVYDDAVPPSLTGNATVDAYSTDPVSGTRSLLATGNFTFGPLPPTIPAAAVDADGNGLSDAWERAFGITDPNSDTDSDGYNAITEQNSGSDPLDPNSPAVAPSPDPKLTVASVTAGVIHLAWAEGVTGYILESSINLNTWTAVSPQPIGNTWSEAISGSRKFYRLRKP